MEKKPINEGNTRGEVKGGAEKTTGQKVQPPSQPPPPPKKKEK